MDKLLLQMIVTFTLLLEKTMSAELDRLNNAITLINDQVSQLDAKVQQLIVAVRSGSGVPEADVANASAQLETLAAQLQNINAQQV